jgi:uncharacterized protein YdaU (DUF1376 family)
MAKDPAVLFYTNDFLTGTGHLSRAEKGLYIELLCYQQQKGPLTYDFICKVSGADFDKIWPAIKDKFHCENGLFFNKRMIEEAEKRKKYSESRSVNRKKRPEPVDIIEVKEKKTTKTHETSINNISNSYQEDMENENVIENENENVIEIEIEKEGFGKPKRETLNSSETNFEIPPGIILPFDSPQFVEAWQGWRRYKWEEFQFSFRGGPTEQVAVKQLFDLSEGEEQTAIKIVQQSIANGWKNLFPLGKISNGNGKKGAGKYDDFIEQGKWLQSQIDLQNGNFDC